MKKQDKMNKVIIAIYKAYSEENTLLTERLENIIIPNEEPLPPKLREVLDSWGNSPIEEPEFYALIMKDGTTPEDVKSMALKDADEDEFNALDIATLANRVRYQITSYIDDDGMYKTTPKIAQARLPKTSDIRKLKELTKTEMSQEDFSKEIFKTVQLSEESLTEWEAKLIDEMIVSYVQAVDNNTLGNTSDRTPFARYLKN